MSRPRQRAAAWAFLAPALFAIGAFFVLPLAAAFLLSFTDFDIYAIADRANLRWLGARNYAQLLRDPAFHTALRNTAYFVLVGGPLSVAALARRGAARRSSPGARQEHSSAAFSSCPWSPRWSPSPSFGATSTNRATVS